MGLESWIRQTGYVDQSREVLLAGDISLLKGTSALFPYHLMQKSSLWEEARSGTVNAQGAHHQDGRKQVGISAMRNSSTHTLQTWLLVKTLGRREKKVTVEPLPNHWTAKVIL
jgi:hypothetical protein